MLLFNDAKQKRNRHIDGIAGPPGEIRSSLGSTKGVARGAKVSGPAPAGIAPPICFHIARRPGRSAPNVRSAEKRYG